MILFVFVLMRTADWRRWQAAAKTLTKANSNSHGLACVDERWLMMKADSLPV